MCVQQYNVVLLFTLEPLFRPQWRARVCILLSCIALLGALSVFGRVRQKFFFQTHTHWKLPLLATLSLSALNEAKSDQLESTATSRPAVASVARSPKIAPALAISYRYLLFYALLCLFRAVVVFLHYFCLPVNCQLRSAFSPVVFCFSPLSHFCETKRKKLQNSQLYYSTIVICVAC